MKVLIREKVMNTKLLVMSALVVLQGCQQAEDFYKVADISPSFIEQPQPPIAEIPPVVDPAPQPQPPIAEIPPMPSPGDENEFCKRNPTAHACNLIPYVNTPGVVTILLALGDMDNNQNQLVIKEDSAQLVAINAIKYASPVLYPKILLIRDHNHNGESPNDIIFIKEKLLKGFDVTYIQESPNGVSENVLVGYDLVWHNNPGHPFGSSVTFNSLKKFKGGVILSGDDLARGKGFNTNSLTGLKFLDNGTDVVCGDSKIKVDNNLGAKYEIHLNRDFLPGVDLEKLTFTYGNDIDNTQIDLSGSLDSSSFQILAHASVVSPTAALRCLDRRPVIVRYQKK
jgi:hypothetical protein